MQKIDFKQVFEIVKNVIIKVIKPFVIALRWYWRFLRAVGAFFGFFFAVTMFVSSLLQVLIIILVWIFNKN